MANVNLYSAGQAKVVENKRKSSLGSFVFSGACLVIILGAYGGLKFWNANVNEKISDIDAQVTSIKSELTSANGEMDGMHDVYLRLDRLQKEKESRVNMTALLADLEKNVINGSVLSKYTYDKKENSLTLEGDSVDFNTLMQQMEKFRSFQGASSVSLEKTGFSDKGFALFTIKIVLADTSKQKTSTAPSVGTSVNPVMPTL